MTPKYIYAWLFYSLTASAYGQFQPEPNPPVLEKPVEVYRFEDRVLIAPAAAPVTEWTNHKSADGTHPDGNEQKMMWLMNRARQNPTAEGVWLAESTHPDIKNGRDFFGVDISQLKSAFAALPARAPAAFDVRLYNASRDHSLDLIARDAQDHIGQEDKINSSGFSWSAYRISVFSYAKSALNSHAALNIDWGGDASTGGMQVPPGHRYAIMGDDTGFSVPVTFSNVGLALVAENDPGTSVGPLVFSGAYVQGGAGEFNRFIVGTVWDDLNSNQVYDPGEGLSGVTVSPDSGTYYAITGNAGGYSIPITAAGTYTVTFSGGGLSSNIPQAVVVGDDSVLVDLLLPVGVDTDGDGVLDENDNCPNDDNADQLDTDDDGQGNACDSDDDDDAFSDVLENKYGSDPLVDTSLPQAYTDVAPSDPYHLATLGLDDAGITGACDGAGNFCPDQIIHRDTAAIWLIKAYEGNSYTPAPATGLFFADVGISTFAADYIEDLSLHGGTEGCGAATPLPNYCAEQALTRDQAAKMLLKTKYGAGFSPSATGLVFDDVTNDTFAAGYIEYLRNVENATEACSDIPPLYCPGDALTRGGFAQMLSNTFGLMP